MNLIPGICLLCKQNDQVLESKDLQSFLKFIVNTYFVKQNNLASQFRKRINSESLCVVCACNVEASYKFKKTYEDKIKKEATVKKTLSCCFMCGFRGPELVQTDSNPNQFQENVSLFMEAISQPRFYKQCAVCFVCVLELQNFSKMHASLHAHIKENDTKNNEIQENKEVDDPSIQKEIPEISTPITEKPFISNTAESNRIKIRSVLKPKRARSESASPMEAPPRKYLRGINTSKSNTSLNNSFTLSNCKLVKDLVDSGKINIPESVLCDEKMYVNVPYVKMGKEMQNILDKSLESTTNLSVNTDSVNDKTPVKSSKLSQETKMSKPKVSIKIKLIEKIEKKRRACPKSKKKLNQCTLCNKHFLSVCLLKSHQLWHDKPERLQVNIIRTDISAYLKLLQEKEATIFDDTENTEISESNQHNKDEIHTEEMKTASEKKSDTNETRVNELNSEANTEKMETNIQEAPCRDVNELSLEKDKSENNSSNTSIESSNSDNKIQNSEEGTTKTDSSTENQQDRDETTEDSVKDKISVCDEEGSIQNEVVEILDHVDEEEGKTESMETNGREDQDECRENEKKGSHELDDPEQNNRTSQQGETEDIREENGGEHEKTVEEDTNKKTEEDESEKEQLRNAVSVEQQNGDDGKDKETEDEEEECQNGDVEEKECDNKEENAKNDSVETDENKKDNLSFNLDLMDSSESIWKEKNENEPVQIAAEIEENLDEIESNLQKLLRSQENFKDLEEKEQENENESSSLTDVSKTMNNKYGEDNANVFNSCSNENSNISKLPSNTILKRKCSKSNEDSPKTKKVRFAVDVDEQKNQTSENENRIQRGEILS